MQLVLSNNRVVAYGENFLAMGGVVINTETGAKYDNATVAECEGCPSDIDSVGYEYIGGIFKPCAPFGKGNDKGYVMEVCSECATPRKSSVPIKDIKWETVSTLDYSGTGYSIDGQETKRIYFENNISSLQDYTEFRVILKADSTIKVSKNGNSSYTPNFTLELFIENSNNANNYRGISCPGEADCTFDADYVLKGGAIVARLTILDNTPSLTLCDILGVPCNQIKITINNGGYNVNLKLELQARG